MNTGIDTGIAIIAAERHRQKVVEGWTEANDDAQSNAEMSGAAACYAIAANELACGHLNRPNPSLWAWDEKWWKPGDDPIRCLAKAGALIAAEIDRLQRKKSNAKDQATAKKKP